MSFLKNLFLWILLKIVISIYSDAVIMCHDRDRPVPVLSNIVPLASLLRPKASFKFDNRSIAFYDRSIAFYFRFSGL